MKLPKQAQAISRQGTPGAAALGALGASDCVSSCNQLSGTARDLCLANCT